jgi:hypothetical protein
MTTWNGSFDSVPSLPPLMASRWWELLAGILRSQPSPQSLAVLPPLSPQSLAVAPQPSPRYLAELPPLSPPSSVVALQLSPQGLAVVLHLRGILGLFNSQASPPLGQDSSRQRGRVSRPLLPPVTPPLPPPSSIRSDPMPTAWPFLHASIRPSADSLYEFSNPQTPPLTHF